MGLFSKDIKTMDDLFLHTLQDIYYAENKIVKSLPSMIETAHDAQLKQGLQGASQGDRGPRPEARAGVPDDWGRSPNPRAVPPSTASSRKPRT